jgi:hypothetical protein
MRFLPTHCTNISPFPAANTGSLDVQSWIHARFVQGEWRGGHVAPQGASYEVANLKAMQTCDWHVDLLWWWGWGGGC